MKRTPTTVLATACLGTLALALTACSNDPGPKRPDTGPEVKPPQSSLDLGETKDQAVDAAKDAKKALQDATGK